MSDSLSDPIRYAPVTRAHRRLIAWALAVLLHLALFGLFAGWTLAPAPERERRSLDVVLVTQATFDAVDAEAIAEASQRGLGGQANVSSSESARAGEAARGDGLHGVLAAPARQAHALLDAPDASEAMPVSALPVDAQLVEADLTQVERLASPVTSGHARMERGESQRRERGQTERHLQAEPHAELNQQAAREAAEARYIEAWTRRIEDYGNYVFPAPAHLAGEVRIRVVVGRDGQLRQTEVIQSSPYPELDRVAMATVQGAAPYPRFDRDMGELDSLSITRVWRFGQGNNLGMQ